MLLRTRHTGRSGARFVILFCFDRSQGKKGVMDAGSDVVRAILELIDKFVQTAINDRFWLGECHFGLQLTE